MTTTVPLPDRLPSRPVLPEGTDAVTNWHPDVRIVWLPASIDAAVQATKGRGWQKGVLCGPLGTRLNAMVVCRTPEVCDALIEKFAPRPAPGAGIAAWLGGPDVGTSSKFMARYLLGPIPGLAHVHVSEPPVPRDASDFGRCLALLDAVPELVPQIPRMAEASVEWARVVSVWAEAEHAYLAGDGARCTELISGAGR